MVVDVTGGSVVVTAVGDEVDENGEDDSSVDENGCMVGGCCDNISSIVSSGVPLDCEGASVLGDGANDSSVDENGCKVGDS